jgi:hypothetical protein
MHWISQNYQWLFDGVGGAVLIALIGFAYHRWKNSSNQSVGQQPSSTLMAQGAKVTDSPVASGSNISQKVNSPTVTVNLGSTTQPGLPKLKAEIREVCFDDFLDSLTADLADFTVERYIFVYVWVVNTENVATAVKDWKLTYLKGDKTLTASEVRDFSKWHQHVEWKERGSGFITHSIKEARNSLTPFPSQPLQRGIPSEGWVCFKATGVSGMGRDDGSIQLCIVDSFGQDYRIESPAPFACKGNMVNPEHPW